MFEEIMEDVIISYLENQGYTSYLQIPYSLGKIDFVGIRNNECIIIESKVKNWKKALKQSINYGYGADKAYVAIPHKTANFIKNNHASFFRRYNIGLLSISNEVEILIGCKEKIPSALFKNLILTEILKRSELSKNRVARLLEKYQDDGIMVSL